MRPFCALRALKMVALARPLAQSEQATPLKIMYSLNTIVPNYAPKVHSPSPLLCGVVKPRKTLKRNKT